MDETRKSDFPQPSAAPQWTQDCFAAPKPPFSASRTEQLAALLMYVLAFLYTSALFCAPGAQWWLGAFTAGFVLLAEFLYRDVPRAKESWLWLACVALVLAGCIYDAQLVAAANAANLPAPERALPDGLRLLCLHGFAVYWAMCRAGRLSGGQSGHLLPLDALCALFVFPFSNFFLRIRCAAHALRRKKDTRPSAGRTAAGVLAAFVVLVLLSMAMTQLSTADSAFAQLLSQLRLAVLPQWDVELVLRLIVSVPVGAYVFGLLGGLGRTTQTAMRERGEKTLTALEKLRAVTPGVWLVALGLFCALYLAFFCVQARYLFGAFTRTLPQDFTVAQYARQGFFELCRVMAINFTLFWLITRTTRADAGATEKKLMRWLCVALLVESMLFAVVALSKLGLYISCFGFTPRRLQSTWLACVLLGASAAALYTHLTGRRSMRAWMGFAALSLSVLCLL